MCFGKLKLVVRDKEGGEKKNEEDEVKGRLLLMKYKAL